MFAANVEAIAAHYGIATTTYFVRLNLDSDSMKAALKTGHIVPSQVHRIVQAEEQRFSVRQLVSEDLIPMYPAAPLIDPATLSKNLKTICWEKGIYPAEIAKLASISTSSALNYAKGQSKRIDRGLLAKVAHALGLTLAELVDPSRPELRPTQVFWTNLTHLVQSSSLALTPLGDACRLEFKVLRALLAGSQPNPHQVAKLARYFRVSCRQLLAEDLMGINPRCGEPDRLAEQVK